MSGRAFTTGVIALAMALVMPQRANSYEVLWFHSAFTDGTVVKSLAYLAAGWPAATSMDLDADGDAELVNFVGDFSTEVTLQFVDSRTGDVEYTYTVTVPGGEPMYFPHYAYFDANPSDPYLEVFVSLASGTAAFVLSGAPGTLSAPESVEGPVGSARIVPNPVATSATIEFVTAQTSLVKIEIFDVSGRRVATPVDKVLSPGTHAVIWDGRDTGGRRAASGTYLYRLQVGDNIVTDKAIVVR
jgi:hypothetical protein